MDVSIQTKKAYNTPTKREAAVFDYKKFIQQDVEDFTQNERIFLEKTMKEAFGLSDKISHKLFPNEIKLIKTKGNHYGDETYYTRENSIIIPKAALIKPNYDEFLRVILHEISHIYTRTNPSAKAKLYAAIGFKRIAQPLVIPDSLKHRLLTNPDGVDENWATKLTLDGGKEAFALPLIYANENTLNPSKTAFFQYLGWNYFEMTPSVSGKDLVIQTIGAQQKSTLNTTGINQLFKDKFNTDYIIHPDEIIADNFAIALLSTKNDKIMETLTADGKRLIVIIKEILSSE